MRRGYLVRAAEQTSLGAHHAGAHELRGPAAPPPPAPCSGAAPSLAVGRLTIGCSGCGALHALGGMKVLRVGPAPLTLEALGRWESITAAAGAPRGCRAFQPGIAASGELLIPAEKLMRVRLMCAALLLASCAREPEPAVDREATVVPQAASPEAAASRAEEVPVEPSETKAVPAPRVGECAFNRSDGQYLGPVREVGPLGHRGMADQRAIWVDHPEIGRMDVTYPRNATVGVCP